MNDRGEDPTPPSFSAAWRATADNAAAARHAVSEHLRRTDTGEPMASDIALAVSEAVTNAIVHAYVERDAGEIRLDLSFSAAEITVSVEDDGDGMKPRPDSPGLGLGLPLIATLADHFEAQTLPTGGTRVCMIFRRAPVSPPAPA